MQHTRPFVHKTKNVEYLKFGAIDIGSNAARLLISSVVDEVENPFFKKASLVRVPLRLGHDAFLYGKMTDYSIGRIMHTMHAYKHLLEAHEVVDFKAYATSAMRESENGKEIVKRIKKETGIKLEIITGKKEAEILYSTQIADKMDATKPYLYVDVGGGSTEISFFYNNVVLASRSFKIGTVRLLNDMVKKETWNSLEKWIKTHAANLNNMAGIGTGGNINKLFKMSGLPLGSEMPTAYIGERYEELINMTLAERIRKYNMKIDRADVIIHAANIYKNVFEWANCEGVFVPKVGVADGVVRLLYKEYKGV